MEGLFSNTRFIDVTTFPEAVGLDLKGYQLKAFALLLSSFEQVGPRAFCVGAVLTRHPHAGPMDGLGQHADAGSRGAV